MHSEWFPQHNPLATMKPTRNKVFCPDCERAKMLFETEQKAKNFIRFNSEEIEAVSGYSPQRAYFCVFCNGWHVTSAREFVGVSRKERFLMEAIKAKEERTLQKDEIMAEIEHELIGKEAFEKNILVSNRITALKQEIERFGSLKEGDKARLKEMRQWLDALYAVRKKCGFQQTSEKYERAREQEIDEWRLWAEKLGYQTPSSLDSGE